MAGIASNVGLGRPEPGPTSSRLKELHRDPHIFMRQRVRHRRVRDCPEVKLAGHAPTACLTGLQAIAYALRMLNAFADSITSHIPKTSRMMPKIPDIMTSGVTA
jgi:hypothetical protein